MLRKRLPVAFVKRETSKSERTTLHEIRFTGFENDKDGPVEHFE
jgi:hypothetical protein